MKYLASTLAGILTAITFAYVLNREEPLAVGAPATTIYQKTLLPLADSTYELGTSTRAWLRGNFDELCLTESTCISSWLAGGGGGGGTTLYVQNGGATQNAGTTTLNFTPNSFTLVEDPTDTFAIRVATTTLGLLTTDITEGSKLFYTDARVSSYMSASSTYTNLQSFYTTPSTRITAGDGLTWSGNTMNFDGGNAPAGALGGTWASPTVDNDGHSHTGATLSGIDISDDTNLTVTATGLQLSADAIALAASYFIPTTTRATNWDTAFSWGNHATQGYLTGITGQSIEDLSDVTTFTQAGQDLFYYNGSAWDRLAKGANGEVLQTNSSGNLDWVATSTLGLGGAGGGTVTSVDMTVPTGLTVSGNPVTTSGTLAIALGAGYNIPLTASTTNWNTAYGWGNHASQGYITDGNTNWDNSYGFVAQGQTVGTTTAGVAGQASYWTGIRTLGTVATGTLTESVAGLEFDNSTRGLFGGSAALSLTSGYNIPLTASTSNWNTAFNWGNHASQGYLTTVDISANTNLSADGTEIVLTGDALSLGTALSFTTGTSTTSFFSGLGYFTNLVVTTLANFLNVVVTGLLDVGGGVLEIPNGAAPVADDVGEIAHDTTGNQLIVDDYVVPLADQRIWGVTVASTSPAFISGGLLASPTNLDGYTITRIQCHVVGGTSKVIAVEDASANSSEDITCATTNTTDDGSITNATYTASELQYIDFGATTGAVDTVSISVFGNWTRE